MVRGRRFRLVYFEVPHCRARWLTGISVIDQQGEVRPLIAHASGTAYCPRYSPDGSQIAYVLNVIGDSGYYDYSQFRVYIIPATGSGTPALVQGPGGWRYPPAWVDNDTLLVRGTVDGVYGYYYLDTDGGAARYAGDVIPQTATCLDYLP